MYKVIFIALGVILFSISSFSETEKTMPIEKFLLLQLTSSKYDYAEKEFTGIIYHYGRVQVGLDKFSSDEIEFLKRAILLGQFADDGVIHNVRGVQWNFTLGLDFPKFINSFISHGEFKVETHVMKTKERYARLQRWEYPIIPELEEKRSELAQPNVEKELQRIFAENDPYSSCKLFF